MKCRVIVNTVQRWVSAFHMGVCVWLILLLCVSPSSNVFFGACVCVCACIVLILLLQRSRHILEARRCGVVAIPRHTPERDQTSRKSVRTGTERRRKKISWFPKLQTHTRTHTYTRGIVSSLQHSSDHAAAQTHHRRINKTFVRTFIPLFLYCYVHKMSSYHNISDAWTTASQLMSFCHFSALVLHLHSTLSNYRF